LLYAIFWILLWLLRRLKEVKHLRVRVIPSSPCSHSSFHFSAAENPSTLSAAFGLWSVLFFLGSIAFAALSLVGLYLAVSVPRDENPPRPSASTPSSSPSPPASSPSSSPTGTY